MSGASARRRPRLVVLHLDRGDLGVVQVERRRLERIARDAVEVVPRRRAAGRPLERAAPAPWVVDLDQRRVPRDPDVVEERQGRRPSRNAPTVDTWLSGEAVLRQVVGVPTRHALDTQPVLDQERRVEADEQQPEVHLAQRSSSIRPVIFGHQK
jgi:hypothetical protein